MAASERSRSAASKQASVSRAILLVDAGKQLLDAGDLAAALESFREAAQISPRSEEAHLYHGIALRSAGETASALEALDRCLLINPRRAEAHYRRGLVLEEAGRGEEALAALESAVGLAPSLVTAQLALGRNALGAGDLPSARRAFSAVLAWRPGDGEALEGLSRARGQPSP